MVAGGVRFTALPTMAGPDHVVLELLVAEEQHPGDHRRGRALGEGEQHEERAAEEPADLRDEVGERRPDGGDGRERNAEQQTRR